MCSRGLRSPDALNKTTGPARYARGTEHNFVLAHRSCKDAKRDIFAVLSLVESWHDRNTSLADEFDIAKQQSGLVTDLKSSISAARWTHQQGFENSAHSWVERKVLENLAPSCLDLFWQLAVIPTAAKIEESPILPSSSPDTLITLGI